MFLLPRKIRIYQDLRVSRQPSAEWSSRKSCRIPGKEKKNGLNSSILPMKCYRCVAGHWMIVPEAVRPLRWTVSIWRPSNISCCPPLLPRLPGTTKMSLCDSLRRWRAAERLLCKKLDTNVLRNGNRSLQRPEHGCPRAPPPPALEMRPARLRILQHCLPSSFAQYCRILQEKIRARNGWSWRIFRGGPNGCITGCLKPRRHSSYSKSWFSQQGNENDSILGIHWLSQIPMARLAWQMHMESLLRISIGQ